MPAVRSGRIQSGSKTCCLRLRNHGSRWEFAEDKVIDLPQGVGKIRAMTDYEETQYASLVAAILRY